MLNTSLHNPSVKDKPTVERFITMNRGINDGGDLPPDLLTVSRFTLNPYVSNGLSNPYQLDESTFIFRGIGSNFCHFWMKVM